jgi:ABC-type bacteriocin/lantibiotic exporter with double-glycine peptidase domain
LAERTTLAASQTPRCPELEFEEVGMSIDYTVPYVPQSQEMSCWAAATAMVMGWKTSQSLPEQQILDHFREFGTDGMDAGQCLQLAQKLGMNVLPEMCRTPQAWDDALQRGPIMVGIPGHWIVLAGITGDMTADGTMVHILDPARGEFASVGYSALEQQYEMGPDFTCDTLQY